MKPEEPKEWIQTKVDIPLLMQYFDFHALRKKGNIITEYSIEKKYCNQVKDLLSEFSIQDQKAINNFSYLVRLFEGQYLWANDLDDKPDEIQEYCADLSKFGYFMEEFNIKSILFKGESKAFGAEKKLSLSFKSSKFIIKVEDEFKELVKTYKIYLDAGIFESEKRKPGAQVGWKGMQIRELIFNLSKYLHDLPFPELNDLSEREENYFTGRFFTIAGIIDPFPEESEDNTAYKSPKDYYVKRIQKYR